MEEKIDKLIQGQVEIKTKIEALTEKTKDQESRIRKLWKKVWKALSKFFNGIATFIEGLWLNK